MAVDRNAFFREATIRICGRLDIENALQECLLYIREFIPADRLSLTLFEKGFGAVKVFARASPEWAKKLELVVPLSIEARSEISSGDRRVRTSQGPFGPVVDNKSELQLVRNMLETFDEPPSSVMFMPLVVQGVPLGSVVVIAHGLDRFEDEHAELFALLREPFFFALSNSVEHRKVIELKERLIEDNQFLRKELDTQSSDEIVGARFGMAEVMTLVRQVGPLTSPVLLLGETGTGKDLVARAIHDISPRSDGPFIGVNCGALADTMLDSELFGHEKGAFTGAHKSKPGRFERAHLGTIFLDEVGELSPAAQVRLLRVLQSGELERVGATSIKTVDTRVIAATHRDLKTMVEEANFREDLYFRLNVFPISIPPLRERRTDIQALVHHFVATKSRELKLPETPTLSPGAIDRLLDYAWPGNVRELQNVVERALIVSDGKALSFDSLVPATASSDEMPLSADEPLALDHMIARHIRQVLELCDGKIHGPGGAASVLEVNPSTLRNKMNKLGIRYGRKGRH